MHFKFLLCVRGGGVCYEGCSLFNFFLYGRARAVCVVMNMLKGSEKQVVLLAVSRRSGVLFVLLVNLYVCQKV